MDVSTAVAARTSIRDFLPDPIDSDLIAELLTKASRAPSGGNLQPWRVSVINGEAMERFRAHMAESPPSTTTEYQVYPPKLWEPYRTNRFQVGEDMYALLGIGREDKAARYAHLARNMDFFGAPCGFFCWIDRKMGPPQWSDLGMFLQTFMLLATEAGLSTCAQEFWSSAHEQVRSFTDAPQELMLFCGMAIGLPNNAAPVNELVSRRMPLAEWATFL